MKKLLLFITALLPSMGTWAQQSFLTTTRDINVSAETGIGVTSTDYSKEWSLNGWAGLTLNTGNLANNMKLCDNDNSLCLHAGTSKSCTYNLVAPDGWIISGYSFDYVLHNSDASNTLTLTIGNTSYTPSTEIQSVSVENLNTRTTSFLLSGSNDGIKLTNFVVYVSKPLYITSTAENPKYYMIASYNRGGVLTNKGGSQGLKHISAEEGSFWYFEQAENEGVYIVNKQKDGDNKLYVGSDRTTSTTPAVWYILENGVNKKGVVLSSAKDINGNTCIDANFGNGVGSWKPTSNDWEGTTWVIMEPTELYNPLNLAVINNDDRIITKVGISKDATLEEQYADISVNDFCGLGLAYNDMTHTVFQAVAGEDITAYINRYGSWTHAYVYIDKDGDGFTAGIGSDGYTPTGDLVTYSFYSGNESNDATGKNSAGNQLSGNSRNTITMPSFKAPVIPGKYRMRFKQDWNSIDPNGAGSQFMSARGAIVDVVLEVLPKYPVVVSTDNTRYYAIKSGRGDYWYTYNPTDGSISLTSFSNLSTQLWFFKEVYVDGISYVQLYPHDNPEKAVSYPSNTEDGTNKIRVIEVNEDGDPIDNTYKNLWLFDDTNINGPFGLLTYNRKTYLSNHSGTDHNMGLYSGSPSNDTGTAMYFTKALPVTYELEYGELTKKKVYFKKASDSYPDFELPFGVSATSSKPEGEIGEEHWRKGGVTVQVSLESTLPFKVAAPNLESLTEENPITNWYYLKFDANVNNYLYYAPAVDYLPVDRTEIEIADRDAYTWAFVGNPFDGFSLINRKAGLSMILSSANEPTTDKEYPKMVEIHDMSTNANKVWDLSKSSFGTDGFFMAFHGTTKRLNKQDSKLCYWLGGADAGSTFMLEERDVVAESNMLTQLYGVSWSSSPYVSWSEVSKYPENLRNATSATHFTAGHKINKAQTTITSFTKYIDVTFNSTEDDGALCIVGVDLVDSKGKIVAYDYHLGVAGPESKDNTYYLKTTEIGDYVLRYYVCEDTNNPLYNANGNVTVSSVQEMSSDMYSHFYEDLKTVAQKEYERIKQLYPPYWINYNDYPGYYTHSSLNQLNDFATEPTPYDICKLIDALFGYTLEIDLPKDGSFYYIKCKDDYYLSSGTSGRVQFSNPLSLYLYKDGKFVSYETGYYLKESNGDLHYTNQVDESTTVAFKECPQYGYLYVNFDDGYRRLGCNGSGDSNAEGEEYQFIIEPVNWIPFTFKSAALGFATFHAPMEVQLPTDVNAYTCKVNGNTLILTKIDSRVPAYTPVLLFNPNLEKEGDTNITLIVFRSGSNGLKDNDFTGTVAAEALKDDKDCYSLQKIKDADAVGFCKKSTGTKGGFKAWLELDKSANSNNARTFTIIFDGDDATGLKEALGIENENVEIYDLSGRRLDKPTKGINIINGKKVIK